MSGSAVRAIFEDKSGNYWFGDSNSGLFHYDARLPDAQGKSLINVAEEKGLGNADFVKALTSKELTLASGMDKESTLASIMTINEDKNGALWIGTFNAGILRYDGKNLTNYTINDGLSSNTIMAIYKDQKGNLWFGTDTGSVYKYN